MTIKVLSAARDRSNGADWSSSNLAFPADARLRDLSNLFDVDWAWSQVDRRFQEHGLVPDSVNVRQFSHAPGVAANASYVATYPEESFTAPRHFSINLRAGRPTTVYLYPDDRLLPGLVRVAESSTALDLINEHVFEIPRRNIHVSVVRYRHSSRAVLKHRLGRVRFYVRVVRPRSIRGLLEASTVGSHSSFVLPRIAGVWGDGGVIWIPEIPGENLRKTIRSGIAPDLDNLLGCLASLWAIPATQLHSRPKSFDLAGAYSRAYRSFSHVLKDHHAGRQVLADAKNALAPFVKKWRPTSIAHNDFYDDQMVALPDGRVALADFEDIGLGDPMLDVGNCLAHTLWASKNGNEAAAASQLRFYNDFRAAALEFCGWNESELSLREAVCVFRICTNAIRKPKPGWSQKVISGLQLVNEIANHSASGNSLRD